MGEKYSFSFDADELDFIIKAIDVRMYSVSTMFNGDNKIIEDNLEIYKRIYKQLGEVMR